MTLLTLLQTTGVTAPTDVDEPVDATWVPGIDEIGTLLRGRTRDPDGRLLGTFTAQTDPTADQVEEAVDDAVEEVNSAVPFPLPDAPGDDPDALRRAYRRVIVLLAAANVELSYPTSRGTLDHYDRLYKRYQDTLARLVEAIAETGGGGGGLSVETTAPGPLSNFSDDTLVGPSTVY